MNLVEYGLQMIKNNISSKILELAFYNTGVGEMFGQLMSIDQNIRDMVIRDRVIVQINGINGELKDVPMNRCRLVSGNVANGFIYHIPKSETEGRDIISIQNVTLAPQGSGFSAGYSNYATSANYSNDLATFANASLRASGVPSRYSYTDFLYRGNNNVFLPAALAAYPVTATFRCILENDANLSNLSNEAKHAFGKMCTMAAKGYIYNELMPKLDQGYIEGGVEIGWIKDEVSNYSDSNQNLQEFLDEEWPIVAMLADPTQRRRATRLMVGSAS